MQKTIKHIAAVIGILIIALLAAYFLDLVAASSKTLLLFVVAALLIMEFQFLRCIWNPKFLDQSYHRQKWQEYKKIAYRRKAVAPDFDPESGEMLPPRAKTTKATKSASVNKDEESGFTPDRWESSLTSLWEGSEDLSFNYASRNSVKKQCAVTLESVLLGEDKCFYLRGICRDSQAQRTYNVDSVKGRVSCDGKQVEIYDFFMERLGISEAKVFFLNVEC
ncbi:MAG: hypothetical protein LBV80_04630 [Deltaproteobacteria bacterium]|nr:hypothetical protein [Deltaproteobacteria bacterium]